VLVTVSYREQALFRDALGEWYSTPTPLLDDAKRQRVSVQQMRWA
jgi:hypothetical protein